MGSSSSSRSTRAKAPDVPPSRRMCCQMSLQADALMSQEGFITELCSLFLRGEWELLFEETIRAADGWSRGGGGGWWPGWKIVGAEEHPSLAVFDWNLRASFDVPQEQRTEAGAGGSAERACLSAPPSNQHASPEGLWNLIDGKALHMAIGNLALEGPAHTDDSTSHDQLTRGCGCPS